jgi:hypothetical protein
MTAALRPTIACPSCKSAVSTSGLLSACSKFWADIDTVRFTCPRCEQHADARLESGRVWLGYVYAAGIPHFCGMEQIGIDGLRVWRDGTDLVAELDQTTWRIRP